MSRRQRRELPTLYERVLSEALEVDQLEVCGLISWDGRHFGVWKAHNVAPDPSTSFIVDPKDQRRILQLIEHFGHELFGCFHSHPHEGPEPSVRDMALAEQHDQLGSPIHWVIVGLEPIGVWIGKPGWATS